MRFGPAGSPRCPASLSRAAAFVPYPLLNGSARIIFAADLQAQGRRRRGLPEPLSTPVALAGKSLPAQPGGAKGGGGRSGGAQHLPGVLLRRAGQSGSRPGAPPPGAVGLFSQKSLPPQLPENKCPPHGVTHLL